MFPARYSPDQPSTARPSADQGRVRRAHTVYTGAGEICQVPPGYHHGTTNTLTASLAMSDYYQYLSTVSSDHHLSWPAEFSRNIKIKSQSGGRQWCCLPRTAGRLCGPVREPGQVPLSLVPHHHYNKHHQATTASHHPASQYHQCCRLETQLSENTE